MPNLYPGGVRTFLMIVERPKWRLAGTAIVALLLVVALHLGLNSGYVRGWVLERVKKTLVAQFGDLELGDRFSVDWVGRVTAGPLTLRDEQGTIFSAASVTVRLAYLPLLTGRVVPAAITLDKPELDLDLAREVFKHLLENRRAKPREPAHAEQRTFPEIRIWANDVRLKTGRAGLQRFLQGFDPLSGKLTVRKSAADWRIEGNLRFSDDGRSRLDAQTTSDGGVKLKMSWQAPHVARMFDRHNDLPLTVKEGELLVSLEVEAEQNFRRGTASCVARVQKLQLGGERLDSQTIGPVDLSGGATVNWDGDAGNTHLAKTEVGISGYAPLPFEMTGRLDLWPEPRIDIEAAIHKLDFPRLLRALPPQLSPGREVPVMTGAVNGQFALKGPVFQPDKLDLAAKLDLTNLHPTQASSIPLLNSFEYRPADEHGSGPAILVGEKNPDFVSLARIPAFLVGAVTLSEDAGFWAHRGFDFQEIKESLVDAAEEKRFRGASTITQQLAKNLYFSREKTYARKIREAIATLTLEASLPKSRILEIYLNIIEWGPGIYGVAQAAQHYFGCDVSQLTPKQAAFLASVIPNPIKYHVYYRQGALSEVWEKRVHELLSKMRDRGVVTEDEFIQADETPIVFASSHQAESR